MWVGKHNEVIASATVDFEAAAQVLVERAYTTLRGIVAAPDGALHW